MELSPRSHYKNRGRVPPVSKRSKKVTSKLPFSVLPQQILPFKRPPRKQPSLLNTRKTPSLPHLKPPSSRKPLSSLMSRKIPSSLPPSKPSSSLYFQLPSSLPPRIQPSSLPTRKPKSSLHSRKPPSSPRSMNQLLSLPPRKLVSSLHSKNIPLSLPPRMTITNKNRPPAASFLCHGRSSGTVAHVPGGEAAARQQGDLGLLLALYSRNTHLGLLQLSAGQCRKQELEVPRLPGRRNESLVETSKHPAGLERSKSTGDVVEICDQAEKNYSQRSKEQVIRSENNYSFHYSDQNLFDIDRPEIIEHDHCRSKLLQY